MAVTKDNYPELAVKAAESVLLELVHILGEYLDSIVVIGGMVPRYLITEPEEPHVGTTDVDLALDHRRFDEPGYQTLHDDTDSARLSSRSGISHLFIDATVVRDGNSVSVQVDLLSGEYGGTGKDHRTQAVQDVRPRKARGADLAFNEPVRVTITGELPDGAKDTVTIPVAGIVPFIVMKAMAMRDRLKQKDPYDVYYCLRYFPGGIEKIVGHVKLLKGNKLVQEALEILKEKFDSPEHVSPSHIAEFLELSDPDEADLIKRDAYERVLYLTENSKQ